MKTEEDNNQLNRRLNIEKKEPFQSPEGYFENFNTRLRDRMSEPVKTTPVRYTIPVLIGVTAIFAIVFMINRPGEPLQVPVESITYQDLAESGYLYSISEEAVTEAYSTMFHGTPEHDEELEYILGEIDEETLSSNL